MKRYCSVLAAVMALAACGGTDDARTDELGGANFTLTIVSPDHGAELDRGPLTIEVAVTGRGAARGDEQNFDIGYFIDGELVHQGRETTFDTELGRGSHALRVAGLLANGQPADQVTADEIQVIVDANATAAPTVPGVFTDIPVFIVGGEVRTNIPHSEAPVQNIENNLPTQ